MIKTLKEIFLSHFRIPYGSVVLTNTVIILIAMVTWVFVRLLPVTYGNVDLEPEQVDQLTWKETWEFLLHDPYG